MIIPNLWKNKNHVPNHPSVIISLNSRSTAPEVGRIALESCAGAIWEKPCLRLFKPDSMGFNGI
jgi:hypothetical protein